MLYRRSVNPPRRAVSVSRPPLSTTSVPWSSSERGTPGAIRPQPRLGAHLAANYTTSVPLWAFNQQSGPVEWSSTFQAVRVTANCNCHAFESSAIYCRPSWQLAWPLLPLIFSQHPVQSQSELCFTHPSLWQQTLNEIPSLCLGRGTPCTGTELPPSSLKPKSHLVTHPPPAHGIAHPGIHRPT